MRFFVLASLLLPLIYGCSPSKGDLALAFNQLSSDKIEIRMGHLPQLRDEKCDRLLHAGYRTDDDTQVTFHIEMSVSAIGSFEEAYIRDLKLKPYKNQDLLVGQTRLFPKPIQGSCRDVTVKMETMRCTYGKDNTPGACPKNIKWNWLQGFQMFHVPQVN